MPAIGNAPRFCPYCRRPVDVDKYIEETDWIKRNENN